MASSPQPAPKTALGIRWSIQSKILIFTAFLFIAVVYISTENHWWIDHQKTRKNGGSSLSQYCDMFSGKWVYDSKYYPLYKEKDCSFEMYEIACEKAGRKDLKYQNWRWQPRDCDLPRFNAKAMLERLRGKRLVFVGDSILSNQWASLVCLLESSIPKDMKLAYPNGSLNIFEAKEYNASIEFYWSPFLLESNSDHPVIHHASSEQIVRYQSIEKHARHWTDADILVFNSHLWWRRPKVEVLWASFESPDRIYKEVETLRAYEMVLKTWSDWLDIHVNHTRTQLFFLSMSATHERGDEWGKAADQNCFKETEPISKDGYRIRNGPGHKMMRMVEEKIHDLKIKRGVTVKLLNITQLTEYRKEAHPSIYKKPGLHQTKEQLSNITTQYSDCMHWCLPGVPDVWNEILYAYIMHNEEFKETILEV